MKLILARHGNTFGPGDIPVWVGAKEDFPLVTRGLEQACEVAEALLRLDISLSGLIAGPLRRTRTGADIIADKTGFSGEVEIDHRLTEIDYGSWGGKSDDEIISLYGAGVIEDWREHSIRPSGADWSPDQDTLRHNALRLLNEIKDRFDEHANVMLVSSNGILRYYHAAIYGPDISAPSAKVKTGHMCIAEMEAGHLKPVCWNVNPKDF